MSNVDLEQLMHDAAGSEDGVARPDLLAGKLRRVDRVRRLTAMATTAVVTVVALVGVAAAWPETNTPLELRVGVDGQTEPDVEKAPDPADDGALIEEDLPDPTSADDDPFERADSSSGS